VADDRRCQVAAVALIPDPARPLPAGRYDPPDFEPPVAFEIPDAAAGRWTAVQVVAGFFDIQHGMGTPDAPALTVTRGEGRS
jgi:hypothetical protein